MTRIVLFRRSSTTGMSLSPRLQQTQTGGRRNYIQSKHVVDETIARENWSSSKRQLKQVADEKRKRCSRCDHDSGQGAISDTLFVSCTVPITSCTLLIDARPAFGMIGCSGNGSWTGALGLFDQCPPSTPSPPYFVCSVSLVA